LEKRQELKNLNDYKKDLSEYIEYGLITYAEDQIINEK
tara:strand:+ start:420 stop:533 length:114 start_codon:yes stop_codon:yes gene_type:complete